MLNKITKSKLIIFSAPSGAGKSTLIKNIIEKGNGDIELSISATTRPSREGEEHGRDYFFISDEEFAKSNKFGMWSMEFDYPWDWRKKN